MDYVIIGGGVYGCGVAWELARRGAEVMLLEAGDIASGASGGLGKRGVRANGRDLRELPLMRLAYKRWPTLHEALGGPTGYERLGHLQLIERERDLVAAPHLAWAQSQQGIPTTFLNGDEVREREPHISETILGALHCPLDGVSDHTETTRSFAGAARRLGAIIRGQTPVDAIETSAGRATAVITSGGERIRVGKSLLVLSNAHVPALLQQHFGLALPVWPRLPQVLLTEPLDALPLRHLIGHMSRTLAVKPHGVNPGVDPGTGRGQVMISGGWLGRWDADAQVGRTQPDQVAGNLAEAVAVFPWLADVPLAEADAGRRETQSADNIPIIDRAPDGENLLYAVGWSGHGWAIAPAVTRLLADWAWSGERPDLLRPFGYGRFGR